MGTSSQPVTRSTGTTLPAEPVDLATINKRASAKLWVAHGAFWFTLAWYCWLRWIFSGNFTPNTRGRGLEPGWYVPVVRCTEVLGVLCTLAILWYYVLRPKLRDGRLSFDGLFFLGCWMMYFQEPWINWTSLQWLYSTTFVNFGSWVNFVPGWSSPNGQLIPVATVWGTAYLWLVGFPGYLGSKFMTWLRSRNPRLSSPRLVLYTFLMFWLFDFVQDMIILPTQLFSFGATVHSLTLFSGTKQAYPIYEGPMWGGTLTILACLHYFRDDQGRSIPERGIGALRIRSPRLNTFARYLAIMGVCQLAILVPYNIPYSYIGQHVDSIPPALAKEPWRTAGVCGPRTNFSCPQAGQPLPRSGVTSLRYPVISTP
jgi:hypothetical protein